MRCSGGRGFQSSRRTATRPIDCAVQPQARWRAHSPPTSGSCRQTRQAFMNSRTLPGSRESAANAPCIPAMKNTRLGRDPPDRTSPRSGGSIRAMLWSGSDRQNGPLSRLLAVHAARALQNAACGPAPDRTGHAQYRWRVPGAESR